MQLLDLPQEKKDVLQKDMQELGEAAAGAVQNQLIKGAEKGYENWQDANAMFLIMKLAKAIGTGNWPSAIAYAAMLMYKEYKERKDADSSL